MPFWRRGGNPGNKDLPRTIQEFVAKAVEGPSSHKIKISEFNALNFALADSLKKHGMETSAIPFLLKSKLVGTCPNCGIAYTGDWLSYVTSPVLRAIGLSTSMVRFLQGKCRNPNCNSEEMLVFWRAEAEAPVDTFIKALGDETAEVRKAAAKALGEIPPDASGYHDPNFVKVTVAALTKALKDEDEDVREAAKEALDKIKAKANKS